MIRISLANKHQTKREFIVYNQTSSNEYVVAAVGEIRGVVSEELEEKFRKLAMQRFGYGKGSLSKALEEALLQWILLKAERRTS